MKKTSNLYEKLNKYTISKSSLLLKTTLISLFLLFSWDESVQDFTENNLLNDKINLNISLDIPSWSSCSFDPTDVEANYCIDKWDFNKAIDIYLAERDSLLKIESNWLSSESNRRLWHVYVWLWRTYFYSEKYEESLIYYKKSKEISEKTKNIAWVIGWCNDISSVYIKKKEYDNALKILLEWISILDANQSLMIASNDLSPYMIHINLCDLYMKYFNNYNKAKESFLKSKEYFSKIEPFLDDNNQKENQIVLLTYEADFANYNKNYKSVIDFYQNALVLAKSINHTRYQLDVLSLIKDFYHNQWQIDSSYHYQSKEFFLYRTFLNEYYETQRSTSEAFFKNKELELKNEKQQTEIKLQKQKTKAARTVWWLAFALTFVLWWAVIVYWKQKKEISKKNQELEIANNQIKEKNQELEQSNEEIRAINDELNEKNQIIEKANKETTASITYASFIQKSFLSSNIKKHFPDSFLYYQPRDIVGGDLYFADELSDGRKILIAGDCTWHWVPGGFLVSFSIDSIKNLSKIAQKPSDIINWLDCKFMENYSTGLETSPEKNHLNDSMDVACVFYTPETRLLEYSISSRSILLLRKGEFIRLSPEIRADVWSTKKHPLFTEYKTYTQQLEPGDEIFLSSDGVSDQFNNKTDRKLWVKAFHSFLQTLSTLPMAERPVYTANFYNKLKENNDWTQWSQTDDILLIGFKV